MHGSFQLKFVCSRSAQARLPLPFVHCDQRGVTGFWYTAGKTSFKNVAVSLFVFNFTVKCTKSNNCSNNLIMLRILGFTTLAHHCLMTSSDYFEHTDVWSFEHVIFQCTQIVYYFNEALSIHWYCFDLIYLFIVFNGKIINEWIIIK